MFDAKAWLAAHEPPSYTDRNGKKHIGKHWSHLEYTKWLKVFARWKDPDHPPTDEQYATELREMIASHGFTDDVVAEMIELPSVALEDMLKDFFDRQRAGAKSAPSMESSTPAPEPRSPSSPTTEPASPPSAS